MEVAGDIWIMKGCDPDSPDCLHSPEELAAYLDRVGFLPLFSNSAGGFSVEEHTTADAWWTGDPRTDPWEWRQLLSRNERLAYGKFFDRKAGFITKEWFPIFANYRRNGYDFDALCDDGLVPHRNRKLMDAFLLDEEMTGLRWLSAALKEQAGFGKGGEKNFEGVLTELQMQSYLIVGDFRQKRNRRGEGYGWYLAELETPETKWGYDHVTSGYGERPEDSWMRLAAQAAAQFPEADPASLEKHLSIRWPGSAKKTGNALQKDEMKEQR